MWVENYCTHVSTSALNFVLLCCCLTTYLVCACCSSAPCCVSHAPTEMIRHLPLAKDVVLSARQELVMRLDGYCEASRELFEEVSNDTLCVRVLAAMDGV